MFSNMWHKFSAHRPPQTSLLSRVLEGLLKESQAVSQIESETNVILLALCWEEFLVLHVNSK